MALRAELELVSAATDTHSLAASMSREDAARSTAASGRGSGSARRPSVPDSQAPCTGAALGEAFSAISHPPFYRLMPFLLGLRLRWRGWPSTSSEYASGATVYERYPHIAQARSGAAPESCAASRNMLPPQRGQGWPAVANERRSECGTKKLSSAAVPPSSAPCARGASGW